MAGGPAEHLLQASGNAAEQIQALRIVVVVDLIQPRRIERADITADGTTVRQFDGKRRLVDVVAVEAKLAARRGKAPLAPGGIRGRARVRGDAEQLLAVVAKLGRQSWRVSVCQLV